MMNLNSHHAALLLRLGLGVMYIAHSLLKVMVFGMPGTVEFFASFGFPGWLAYVVAAAELAGGVLLIAGVMSRWVALGLIPVLVGALVVHGPNGWLFSTQGGGWEYPVFLILVSLALAILGDGAFALRRGGRETADGGSAGETA